jgi:hypothetical protein
LSSTCQVAELAPAALGVDDAAADRRLEQGHRDAVPAEDDERARVAFRDRNSRWESLDIDVQHGGIHAG